MTQQRQMSLGAFLQGVGHHLAAWRHPDVQPELALQLAHYQQLAQIAERGQFDAIFFADVLGVPQAPSSLLTKGLFPYFFDPLILLSALAGVTKKIGLVATVSSTYLPPFHLARKLASLDQLSNGRAGWNLVTSGTDAEASNFGLDSQIPHAERYQRAQEYLSIVKGLWDSWGDDAFIFDQAAGQVFDPAKLFPLNHQGAFFNVSGPLTSQRPVQGYPVIVQAGSSSDGQQFAAHSAEVVFTAQQTFDGARAFYRGLKEQVLAAGRDPDSVKILPGVLAVVGQTREAAQAKFDQLQALIDPAVGLGLLSGFLGNVDLSQYPLDEPLPELPITEGWQSRQQLFYELARRENLSLRQLYLRIAGARGHWVLIGTASDIADQLEFWFNNGAADGFNILAPTFPQGLTDFVDLVIPELQRRGLFRTEYQGATLREHLGLPYPQHPSLAPAAQQQAIAADTPEAQLA